MIVVEGPDGAGKTTLIKELMSQFPLTLAPRVVDKDTNALVDLKVWVEKSTQQLNQGMIFDRHRLVSELIYGPIMRPDNPEPGFEDPTWLTIMMSRFYVVQKPTIIYCLPPLKTVAANVAKDPDNDAVAWAIGRIWRAYAARVALDADRSILHDYTRAGDLKRTVSYVMQREYF